MIEITVIIPSFNMRHDLLCALESVLSQSILCELIVVDDCSSPPLALPETLQENNRVRLIRQPTNKGASAARNIGIKACNTPWFTFLDSDDLLLPDSLKHRLQFAKEAVSQNTGGPRGGPTTENTFFCCGWINPSLDADSQQIRIPNPANRPEEFASGCWYSPGSCALFHRSFFEVKGRQYDENLRRLEDFDWGIRTGLTDARMVSHPIAGVSIKPSNRTNLQAIKTVSAQILQKFSHLRNSQPKVYASVSAYLALEQATFSAREKKWVSSAFNLIRSYMARPRLRRHFSPGWTYEKYKTAAPKELKS